MHTVHVITRFALSGVTIRSLRIFALFTTPSKPSSTNSAASFKYLRASGSFMETINLRAAIQAWLKTNIGATNPNEIQSADQFCVISCQKA